MSGKHKGSGFEREVCVAMSKWTTAGQRDDIYWRSAMSGGRATVQFKAGKKNLTQGGDISAVDPLGHKLLGHFAVECKFYKKLDIETSLLRGYGKLIQFWGEATRMAKRQKKIPILIAKQNNFPALVLTDDRGIDILGMHHLLRVRFNNLDGRRRVSIVRFDDMLKEPFPL